MDIIVSGSLKFPIVLTVTKPPYHWECYTESAISTLRFHLDYDDHDSTIEIVPSYIKSFKIIDTSTQAVAFEGELNKTNIGQYFDAPTGETVNGRIAKDFVIKVTDADGYKYYQSLRLELNTVYGTITSENTFTTNIGIYPSDLKQITKAYWDDSQQITYSASPDMWFGDFADHDFELYLFNSNMATSPVWNDPPLDVNDLELSSIRSGHQIGTFVRANENTMIGPPPARPCIYLKYKLGAYPQAQRYNTCVSAKITSVEIGSATIFYFTAPILINPDLYR